MRLKFDENTVRNDLLRIFEQGLLGSRAYVSSHVAEMPNIDAILITDTGAKPAKGWYDMGREDEWTPIAALKPVPLGCVFHCPSIPREFAVSQIFCSQLRFTSATRVALLSSRHVKSLPASKAFRRDAA